jgi:hypothetical protein
MKEKFWNDNNTDGDRKRRRQAEFLVQKFFPFHLILGIGVMSEKIASCVKEFLENSQFTPGIKVIRSWY